MRALGVLFLLGVASCSKQVTRPFSTEVLDLLDPNRDRPDPGVVYPDYQVEPEWTAPDVITYRDLGVVCVGASGGYQVDPSLAGIWSISPAGGVPRHIVRAGYNPTWNPARTLLAFEQNGQIYTMTSDSSVTTRLTNSVGSSNFFPAWSPSGLEIAFDSDSGGYFGIWVMSADGSNKHLLIPNARLACWDPAGRSIICAGALNDSARTGGVLRFDVASMTTTLLLRGDPAIIESPHYSPDGSRIVFSRQYRIWVMNADGSGAGPLAGIYGSLPSWSPDGTALVYTKPYPGWFTPDGGVLWTVKVSTLAQQQVTQHWPMQCP